MTQIHMQIIDSIPCQHDLLQDLPARLPGPEPPPSETSLTEMPPSGSVPSSVPRKGYQVM